MSKELSLFASAGLPSVDMNAFKQSIKAAATAQKAALTGFPFLRMGKDGEWVYGPENIDVEEGSLWALNPFSMEQGYIAWGAEKTRDEGTVLGREMAKLTEPQVSRGSLPDVGAEWKPCVAFNLLCISGEDKGTMVKYESNSYGGRSAYANILQAVASAMEDGSGKVVPIVELDSSSYQHKKYGKLYNPTFDIKKWVMPDDKELGGGSAPPAPQAAEVEPPQEEKAAAPQQEGAVRQRRRR